MAHGWEGSLVRLVALDEEKHFENAVRWVNDPEVTQWLLIGDFPLTRLAEREWFQKASQPDENQVVFAIETLDGRHVGTSGIHQISWRHGTASTGSLIGEKECWGKGYGTDAASIRARYCFEVLGLRLLLTSYLSGNDRSMGMSRRVGYQECGRVPAKYWKRGAWRDEVLLYLDRDSWLARQAAKD